MIRAFLFMTVLLAVPAWCEDDEIPATEGRRYTIGATVQGFPLKLFQVKTVSMSTTKPIADYTYTGSSNSQKAALGGAFEYRLRPRLGVGAEFMLHHAAYAEKEEMRSGKKDPNASTDDRKVTTITQTTKANYWEIPLLVRYYGLRDHGWWLSKTYLVGGAGYRHVGRVRTGTEFSYADGSTDYHEIAAHPTHSNQFGPVVGIGFRWIDEMKVKYTPEVRFTRWLGSTFEGESYHSVTNEVRVGLGITF